MTRRMMIRSALLGLIVAVSPSAAAVKLPALIADGMVVQRGGRVPIWGTAEPGERVNVTMGGRQATTSAGDDGRWIVRLDPVPGGGPVQMVVTGSNRIEVRDILVGDVWICAGQSNMEWPVRRSRDAEAEIAAANHPLIRLFSVRQTVFPLPALDTQGSWDPVTPETIPKFSAVGYFFGREIHKTMDVPVGLIDVSKGDTAAEVWMSLDVLQRDADFRPILERWKAADPPHVADDPHTPTGLYNGMISPVIPYGVKGVIWYQGESNDDRAEQYRRLFPALIRSWRQEWDQGDFPFLFVQLANLGRRDPGPVDSTWAELREAQLMALSLPNTAMAVAIDLGEADNIHPPNKQDVGSRLARAAKAIVYGRDEVHSGPIYRSLSMREGKVRLRFDHLDGGLTALGGGGLRGFAIAGEDRKFVWAEAAIEAEEIVVWSDKLPAPAAVRYAWGNNPDCNLGNKAGLPASPFRTDDWPGLTSGKR